MRCATVVPGYDESYFCMYCNDGYCGPCLGYVKHFDMADMDAMIKSDEVLAQTDVGYKNPE